MMRRRLAVYVCMMTAGITAGYLIFEKTKITAGTLFFIASEIAVIILIPLEERLQTGLMMVLGFVLLASSYTGYESFEEPAELIKGRVIRAEEKSEYVRLIVKGQDGGIRYAVDLYDMPAELQYYNLSGRLLTIKGSYKEIRAADNPGCFDYRLYMRSLGIACGYKAEEILSIEGGNEIIWRFRRGMFRSRERFLRRFDDESRSLIKGVIFGDKSELAEDVVEDFNINSSGHILAVSGLHIGFLYTLLKLLSSGRKTWSASVAIIAVLTIYGEISMWSAATIRAVIVLSMSVLSVHLLKDFDLLSSLAAAAFIILIVRPYMLFNSGFQMSFAALSSIAFLSDRASVLFGKALSAAISVQLGIMPLIAMTYHSVNLMAFAVNVPIILLSSVYVPICILALLSDIFAAWVPVFLIKIISFMSDALISVNHALSMGGFFSNPVEGIRPVFVISFYVIVIAASSEWMRVMLIRKKYRDIAKLLSCLAAALVILHIGLFDAFSNDEIIFVAVGQGDCTHIRCGTTDILIDGGGSDFINVGEKILMPYLMSEGVRDIDMAFVTHLHQDHYKGIAELSEKYPVKSALIPIDYEKAGGGSDINTQNIIYLRGESDIKISDELSIRSIWPLASERTDITADDPNEHNMVYMINYRGVRIMVTGDLLEEDEKKMLHHYEGTDALKCDILKAAHHGSKSSNSDEFLDAAAPSIAIIQAGRNNIYGHPHQITLQKFNERNIEIYRTDTDGAVGVDIGKRNGRIRIHTMH